MEIAATRIQVSESRDTWKATSWKRCRKTVFRLQRRIWKAVRVGDQRKARELQKLLLGLSSAKKLAVRQVTQLNQGRKTAGVDGKSKLSNSERLQVVAQLKAVNKWQHDKLREISIPKSDGTQRTLKVPTIADRAWQCLCKYAIEPAHEALFHARSYGFRPGRSAHDAQKVLFSNLSSKVRGREKRVLELDIEHCFDGIAHEAILTRVIAPQAIKTGLQRCLTVGADVGFPDQGTPQGGVISPLLANIALDGIEAIHQSIRYADDMIFILKPKDNADEILAKVERFLAERKLRVKTSKTRVSTTLNGFDFLGWRCHVQADSGKFRSEPSKANYEKFYRKVKAIVTNPQVGARAKAVRIAPMVRGWRNYHQYAKLDGSRFSLWRLAYSAFKRFLREKSATRHSAEKLVEQAFPSVGWSENRFVNVRGDASVYDGNVVYWSKRNSDRYESMTAKVLKRQHHCCSKCGLRFIDDEWVHLHHVNANHHDWQTANLVALHQSCHQESHYAQ